MLWTFVGERELVKLVLLTSKNELLTELNQITEPCFSLSVVQHEDFHSPHLNIALKIS